MAFGMFDGVHLGHQAVIRRSIELARSERARAVVATFDRHPSVLLYPDKAPLAIQTLNQRLNAIASLGVSATWLIRFDRAFSKQSGEVFARGLARDFPALRTVIVGDRFRFGHRRSGSVGLLSALGRELGFVVEALQPVTWKGQPISSTRVRHHISIGDLAGTRELLGRPYTMAGTVVTGDRLGRKLGFPTANLSMEGMALAPNGVYVAHAWLTSWSGPALLSIGYRPTLRSRRPRLRVEVHLLGFEGEIYGQGIELCLLAKLRSEKRFPTLADLRQQIEADCKVADEKYTRLWAIAQNGVRMQNGGGVTGAPGGGGR